MKFEVRKASDYEFCEEITINTLEDLKAIEKQFGSELIVNFEDGSIWIYDGYME